MQAVFILVLVLTISYRLKYQFSGTTNILKAKCDNSLNKSICVDAARLLEAVCLYSWLKERWAHAQLCIFYFIFFCLSCSFQLLTSAKSSMNYITCQNISYRSCSCSHIRRPMEGRTQGTETHMAQGLWYFYLMLLFSLSFLTFPRFVSFEANSTTFLHKVFIM